MPDSITVRFQDVTHKIASVVTVFEEKEIMARIMNPINIEKLEKEIIDKIEFIAKKTNMNVNLEGLYLANSSGCEFFKYDDVTEVIKGSEKVHVHYRSGSMEGHQNQQSFEFGEMSMKTEPEEKPRPPKRKKESAL